MWIKLRFLTLWGVNNHPLILFVLKMLDIFTPNKNII